MSLKFRSNVVNVPIPEAPNFANAGQSMGQTEFRWMSVNVSLKFR